MCASTTCDRISPFFFFVLLFGEIIRAINFRWEKHIFIDFEFDFSSFGLVRVVGGINLIILWKRLHQRYLICIIIQWNVSESNINYDAQRLYQLMQNVFWTIKSYSPSHEVAWFAQKIDKDRIVSALNLEAKKVRGAARKAESHWTGVRRCSNILEIVFSQGISTWNQHWKLLEENSRYSAPTTYFSRCLHEILCDIDKKFVVLCNLGRARRHRMHCFFSGEIQRISEENYVKSINHKSFNEQLFAPIPFLPSMAYILQTTTFIHPNNLCYRHHHSPADPAECRPSLRK